MRETFGATFSGPDMAVLIDGIIDAAPFSRDTPTEMDRKLVSIPTTDRWRELLLSSEGTFVGVRWGADAVIKRNAGAISARFPEVPIEPGKVLAFITPLPFELAVMPPVHMWMDDYFAPAIGADHALLGWGLALKGAGHEQFVASRRWLDHGPWRLLQGEQDTTLIQFHQLDVDAQVSLPQAQAAHAWMVAGFLRPDHRFRHEIRGVYTAEDGLFRVVVNDRPVEDSELLDACVLRRDRRDDPDEPIRNVAYVFMDEDQARERLDALWLRGLECRTLRKGEEVRLDEGHEVPRPGGWW